MDLDPNFSMSKEKEITTKEVIDLLIRVYVKLQPDCEMRQEIKKFTMKLRESGRKHF
jgi:hypothetical protein